MKTFWQLREELNEPHPHGDFLRGENGKPQAFYHGTRQAFGHFKPQFKKKMQLGFGMHFTSDPDQAAKYTEKDRSKGSSPNIHKVFLRAKNPLDLEQMYHKDEHPTHHALHVALHKGTGRKPYVSQEGNFVLNPDVTSPERAQKIIQHHGFDAVKYQARDSMQTGYGRATTDKYPAVTVFHPDQIHHAYGINEANEIHFQKWLKKTYPLPKLHHSIPEKGQVPFIKTDDGNIHPGTTQDYSHVKLAQRLGLHPTRIQHGGFLSDGIEGRSSSANVDSWVRQETAKARIAYARRKAVSEGEDMSADAEEGGIDGIGPMTMGVSEDEGGAPTNNAGSGEIAGIGVGAQGEPGVQPRRKKVQVVGPKPTDPRLFRDRIFSRTPKLN